MNEALAHRHRAPKTPLVPENRPEGLKNMRGFHLGRCVNGDEHWPPTNVDNSRRSRRAMRLKSQGGDAGRVNRVLTRPASTSPVRHAGIRWKQLLSGDFAFVEAINRKQIRTRLELTGSLVLAFAPTRVRPAFNRAID